MGVVFHGLIETLLLQRDRANRIWFASDQNTPPPYSYQVNFPRLELVISGNYQNQIEVPEYGIVDINILAGEALYIPPNCWNKPNWDSDCTVLSLLFGRRQLGFSLVSKRIIDTGFVDVQKHSIKTRSGHAIDDILQALNALAREVNQSPMDNYLLAALLSYIQSMIADPSYSNTKRSENIYQSACIYIQENFHKKITRTHVSKRFNISPNHLSRLFRQQGHMTMADYITWVRVERAKFMIQRYEFRLSEVASRCGFQDVNYFFRVFKAKTGCTPSEYRTAKT